VSSSTENIEFVYREPSFSYTPIPYHPNMLLEGWFQSEKYFLNNKQAIMDLFAPKTEILDYLNEKYSDIIAHPNTVSIHLRSYIKENPIYVEVYPTYGREYVEKAIQLFDADAQFIVFSDQIEWAKEELSGLANNMRFIEGEKYFHDFYLMSMCKHNIICNSTFSWWAAYLNRNPNKVITVPSEWFAPKYNHNSQDLIPQEWVIVK
ncbi:MAG: alpha-1,2-fucosyltransferase, partial [Parachlamydiaceae bacterium]|nr:alpha-1,2-fucosyltransferase [Parachlamydiaceae bacterium]